MIRIVITRMLRRPRKRVWLAVVALLAVVLLVLGLVYKRFVLSGLDMIAEATGSRTTAALCVALALLAVVSLLLWMLFPVIVYFGLRDLRRRTTELDRTMKLCAQQLSRTTTDKPAAKTDKMPD